MDLDALRKQVQNRFNPLQTKPGEPLPESTSKSEKSDPSLPKSMLQQALENRLQSEQETVQISESNKAKLRKLVDLKINTKLLNRLLKGHD